MPPANQPPSPLSAETLFHEARALPEAERPAYLDRACATSPSLRAAVDALLRADAAAGRFLDTNQRAPSTPTKDTLAFLGAPGQTIGRYKLLQLIGEGGFGAVFMAEQSEPVRRRVALKIIKPGMDSRMVAARFEAERQALALMDHPHIARVFDGGVTDAAMGSRPYFVMEYVKGDPITLFADAHKLSIADRLNLFTQVCEAVQHAHTKGVIHRDLKPGNVLVSMTDGRPFAKVIDFGIAKATGTPLTDKTLFTEHRQLIGTPEYMSPEQAEGSPDIDTRTDVYALGVLLYELLTGATPFDAARLRSAAFAEMQRIIKEEDPPAPSLRLSRDLKTLAAAAAARKSEPARLGPLVKGELDWIVMKALDKDRGRRYESPNQMAEDVRRHLGGEAVMAAPPSVGYRVRKFVRKHRGAVLAASAVGAALLIGILGTSLGLYRATVEKGRLTRMADLARDKMKAININYYGEQDFNSERSTMEAVRRGFLIGFEKNNPGRFASEEIDLIALGAMAEMAVRDLVRERNTASEMLNDISAAASCDVCSAEDQHVIGEQFFAAWKKSEAGLKLKDYSEAEKRLRALGAFAVLQVNEKKAANVELRAQNDGAIEILKRLAATAFVGPDPNAPMLGETSPSDDPNSLWIYRPGSRDPDKSIIIIDPRAHPGLKMEINDVAGMSQEPIATDKLLVLLGGFVESTQKDLRKEVRRARLAEASLIVAKFEASEKPPEFDPTPLADAVKTRSEFLGEQDLETIRARWLLGAVLVGRNQSDPGLIAMRRAASEYAQRVPTVDNLQIAMAANLVVAEVRYGDLKLAETGLDRLIDLVDRAAKNPTINIDLGGVYPISAFTTRYFPEPMIDLGFDRMDIVKSPAKFSEYLCGVRSLGMREAVLRTSTHIGFDLDPGRDLRVFVPDRGVAIRAAELYPDDSAVQCVLSLLRYRENDFAGALAAAERAGSIPDGGPPETRAARAHFPFEQAIAAMAEFKLGRIAEARARLARLRAVAAEPRFAGDDFAKSLMPEATKVIDPAAPSTP